jgi:hypothetical protein
MTPNNALSTRNKPGKLLAILLWLSGLEGIVAAASLLILPSESNLFLGLSPARLAVLATILIPCIFSFVFAANITFRKPQKFIQPDVFGQKPILFVGLTGILSVLSFLIPVLLQDLYTGTNTYSYLAYAQRMAPLAYYSSVLFLQTTIWIITSQFDATKKQIAPDGTFLKTWGLSFAGVLALVVFVAVTRFGLIKDPIGWGKPTVPLMEWQIWLGILMLAIFRLCACIPVFKMVGDWVTTHRTLSNWLTIGGIWLAAFALWASLPVPSGFFATPPSAPNFEIYPFSDAAFYDFHAQSMLIGMGFRGESIPPRPLYIVFLAFAHLIMGQDYTRVILLQTAILAFLPVTAFWIGKKLANWQIGLVAAFFIICREWTSIMCTPFTSDVSNSKLMFADMPAALVVSLVLLTAITWLQSPHKLKWALLTGGVLGVSLLVRTQIIILLPVLLVFFWIIAIKRKIAVKPVLLSTLLCLFGFMLAVAPWLSRSYRITGQFVFDHPESQTRVMVQRYYTNAEMTKFDRQPGETTGEYNQRLSTAIREKVMSNPLEIVSFTAAHWLNNEIGNLQIFPVRFSISSLQELVWPQHAFWEDWQGMASPWQTALMVLNLAILTAGVVYLALRQSWVGLLPLVINLAYHFSNSAARNSGWRYLLPADWVFFLYFAAGIFAILNLGSLAIGTTKTTEEPVGQNPSLFGLASLAATILCVGLLPLAAESSFPKIYPTPTYAITGQEIINSVDKLPADIRSGIDALIKDPNAVIMDGRMLYTRFYGAKEGEEKTGKTGYTPLSYARYVFLVAGNPEGTVIFPNDNGELPLRNASDVILAGCMDGLAVQAKVVLLPSTQDIFTASPTVPWACPTQP